MNNSENIGADVNLNINLNEYRDVENYILDIPKFTKKNQWDETDGFYTFLGRPGEQQKIIHVAGTNGKGSVCAYSEAMLIAAGHTCGLFTSPHLQCMRERIRVQRQDIPEEAFVKIFSYIMERCRDYKEDYHPTFFELLFFMAMVWFEETKPEYIILETGLGGRLDTTNIVKNKEICIITKIAYDHMEYLGDTLEKIAAEKAGIITGKAPVIYYDHKKEISEVIREKAVSTGALAVSVSEEILQIIKNHQNFIDFSISFEYYGEYNIRVSSCALYQCMNAALAVYAIKYVLGKALTPKLAADAIEKTVWPCRMEEVLPGIILDGAHNPDGMEALLKSLEYRPEEKILLFAVVKDKEIDDMVRRIAESGLFEQYIITAAGGARAADIGYIEKAFREKNDKNVIVIKDPEQAFLYGRKIRGDRLLIVAGSLYLTGYIRSLCKEDI